jgi:hypothetical protein
VSKWRGLPQPVAPEIALHARPEFIDKCGGGDERTKPIDILEPSQKKKKVREQGPTRLELRPSSKKE